MFQKSILTLLIIICCAFALNAQEKFTDDSHSIMHEKDRARIMNEWLEYRLEHVIPMIMRRAGIDMWLVMAREYNEDPVYLSMVPEPDMAARRTSILIFHDRGEELGVERIAGSFYGMGKWYRGIWTDKSIDQFENLASFIKDRDPKKIGINESAVWGFGDGLTAGLKTKFINALDNKYKKRVVSAEELCVGWLETRIPQEQSVYRHIVGIPHDIIDEFFSNAVIVPDITTTDDVKWWIRQKFTDLGVDTWFQPGIDIQRSPADRALYPENDNVIRRGDVLHCDVGIKYLGLNTDTQQMAYVLRHGETDAPDYLKKAMNESRKVMDIFLNEFEAGRTGNEILKLALDKGKAAGYIPAIYTHPLGFHGHAAGPTIGLWNAQGGVPGQGDYPLYYNTAYSIEGNNKTPLTEWDGQLVQISFEEDAMYTEDGIRYIDGRQMKWHLIK